MNSDKQIDVDPSWNMNQLWNYGSQDQLVTAKFCKVLVFGKPALPQSPSTYTYGLVKSADPEGDHTRVELLVLQIIVENIVYT